MPLDDREQRILEEIERNLYEQDPSLVQAVRNIDRTSRFGVRLPLVGLALGVALVLVFFTRNTFVALAGFVLMVASATALVHALRTRGTLASGSSGKESGRLRNFRLPFRRR